MKRTAELTKFASWFFDLDEPDVPTADPKRDYELLMANGLRALSAEERHSLALFLDECLDGTHSERELLSLWISTSPRNAYQPIVPLLRDVRARLRGSYAFAPFGPPEE